MTRLEHSRIVVVGCDGSWESLVAVETGVREAGLRHCPLMLLAVADVERLSGGLTALRKAESEAVEAATAITKRAAALASAADSTLQLEVLVAGSVVAKELDDVVERAALLVVGGHGARGQVAFSLGTVSGQLVRRFQTPVLVPRLEPVDGRALSADRHPEVVVAVRGDGRDAGLLHAAGEQALIRGWALNVVNVVVTPHRGQQLHHEQEAVWRDVRATPELSSVAYHVQVVEGEPVPTIVGLCGPRDLLVVGTRGQGTLAGLITGSVARGLLDESPCDVLVLPAGNCNTSASPGRPIRALEQVAVSPRSTP